MVGFGGVMGEENMWWGVGRAMENALWFECVYRQWVDI